jgi:hypothetical protein
MLGGAGTVAKPCIASSFIEAISSKNDMSLEGEIVGLADSGGNSPPRGLK